MLHTMGGSNAASQSGFPIEVQAAPVIPMQNCPSWLVSGWYKKSV